ncbi:ABC transporter permease [Glycomyces paridis]|uniref:ABC transporter permease n=1 Tax=Glycomyces paridis TaxID=2126555 RepID=A0A4S8PR37_9ACTN|nr:ABC transporter permease [Glycomyces paridis]THV32082.1 ABC transporter permease [Glycomyces paridis]
MTAIATAWHRLTARLAALGTTALIYLALAGVLVLGGAAVAIDGADKGANLFATANLVDMLTRTSLTGFLAIGMTLVILCRSLDLSVGYTAALSSLVAATTMDGRPENIPVAIGAVLLVSGLIGAANGAIVAFLRVNPFIATLGTGLIIKGYLDTEYKGPAGDVPELFQQFGYTRIGFIPVSALVMLALAGAAVWFLRSTRTGHHMYAVGGDAEVARMSGIRTDRVLIAAHVLCAMCAGVAGLLLAARFGTGSAEAYTNLYELDAIAAVVLGGTLLLGGRGGVAGTVAGVAILAVLDTVFNVMQIDPFAKDVLRGAVIIAAVALYARRQLDRTAARPRFAAAEGKSR